VSRLGATDEPSLGPFEARGRRGFPVPLLGRRIGVEVERDRLGPRRDAYHAKSPRQGPHLRRSQERHDLRRRGAEAVGNLLGQPLDVARVRVRASR
jgi:hypothetical protein